MIAVLQPKGEKSTSSEKNKNKKSYFFSSNIQVQFFSPTNSPQKLYQNLIQHAILFTKALKGG